MTFLTAMEELALLARQAELPTNSAAKGDLGSSRHGRAPASVVGRLLGAGALLLVALPVALGGQMSGLRVEGRAGVGIPVGELAEMVDPGPAVGVTLAYPLSRRVGVKVDGAAEFFGGLPSVRAWHYMAGLEALTLAPSGSPWSLVVDGTVGGTSFGRERVITVPGAPPIRATLLETSATAGGGVRATRTLGDRIAAFGEARWILMLTDADDVTTGRGTTPGFGSLSSVPVLFGVSFRP